jgi:hypothetical protein
MGARRKVTLMKKSKSEEEFEILLRRLAEQQKMKQPEAVKKISAA